MSLWVRGLDLQVCVCVRAEYLVWKGYVKASAVHEMYRDSEGLKASGVVTGGLPDPAARLCADPNAPHLGVFLSLVQSVKTPALLIVIPTETILNEERENGGTDGPGPVTVRTATVTQDTVVQVAWK